MILDKFDSKASFARAIGVEVNFVYNWTYGLCSPSPQTLKTIGEVLEVPAEAFYIAGMEYVQMGVESALTRWSVDQQSGQAPPLTSNEAIQYIKATQPEVVEEANFENKEVAFNVPMPTESHPTSE